MSDRWKPYLSPKYREHVRNHRSSGQVRNEERVISKFDSRNHRRNHAPKFSSPRDQQCKYMSQDAIRSLAQSLPADVLACAGENESGFLAVYQHGKYCNKSLTLKYLIKMLYLLVKADDSQRITSRVLARLFCADATYAVFVIKVDQLIKEMVTERKGFIRRENQQYLNYLTEIGMKAITIIPKTLLRTFPLLSIMETVQCLSGDGDVSDSLKRKVRSLENLFALADEKKSGANVKDTSLSGPYEHFVDIDILPSLSEVFSDDSKVYLPPNIIRGKYKNWDHYLDVQYRLMREDFLRPLRHGIQHFISPSKNRGRREENIRVYGNVRVQNPVCLFSGIGFQVHFDISHLTKVNWEHSKRLIFGSLLCLSKDNFQHSIMLASVVKKDSTLIKDGFLTVKFEGDTSGFHFNPNDVFTMVESLAYFEAYRHILSKLKEIVLISDTIPFKRYIVDSKLRDIPLPLYSLHMRQFQFDLKDTLEIKSNAMINVLSSWPLYSSTCLDESQLSALRMALTKEVSLIQGPPGTGKTFIGLKVVEALLHNRSVWDCNKEAPILIVCYTNHALDQFLEGIQKIALGEEKPNIVRIGGRCKSMQLSNCILRNKVEEFQSRHELPHSLLRKLSESRSGMQASKNEIHYLLSGSSSTDKYVRCLSELKSVMLYRHFRQLEELHSEDGREVEVWLELRCSSFESKQDYDSGSEVVMLEDGKNNIDISTAVDYIDVDNESKLLEDDRTAEGEDIELSAPPNSKLPGASICVTVQADNAKRRKVEKEEVKDISMSIEEVCSVKDVHSLPLERKWMLYNYWERQCTQHDTLEMRKQIDQYNQWCEKHADCRRKIDEYILRGTDVIGMTTTGAAKHNHILKYINPKIVIFEEAAEIFEAHTITSLTPSVQQLVLIGDHKQLRPKPNSYDLEVKYGLAVSLFERMVKNGIDYVTLGVQHRMRPEISSLIHPSIYPELKDHKSVTNYENVRGIAKNVFMVSHTQPEKSEQGNDATTHINEFEAKYLVALCCHLLKQGYQPHQITILTMYRGQLFELRKRMTRETFEGIRVAVVDDFQGEENDIVLLSLVRSNSYKSIGFLDKSNRICVSLSRAKIGLYVIGNLDMLRDRESTVWPKIISDLEKKCCVGNSLPLCCQVHKDSMVWAEFPEDFLKCPEGGCEKFCGVRLTCGHACPRVCHPKDINHQNYKCLKECGQVLPCDHRCVRKCCECATGCRPCSANVKRVIPLCNHEVSMPCGSNPSSFSCLLPCEKPLQCGHICQARCSEPCTRNCRVKVNEKSVCGHKVKRMCYQAVKCLKKCNTVLDCGDKCSGTCVECHMGRLHKSCNQKCGRQLVCGHLCDFPCPSKCPPCMKVCNNFCIHSRCPKRCYESCTPCMELCQWRCKHLKCTLYCGEICDRPPCNEPCEKILECGHPCIGLCGEKCPSRCRICDKELVCDIFFGTEDEEDARFVQLEDCGHFFEVSGLDAYFGKYADCSGEVKFITCPKCRTPIRTSLRYCNKVKQILKDVEGIKLKQLITNDDLKENFSALKLKAAKSNMVRFIEDKMTSLGCSISNYKKLHPFRVKAMLVQISILSEIINILEVLSTVDQRVADNCKSRYVVCDKGNIIKDLRLMKSFLFQEFLSNQQVLDITAEARRVSCAAKLCKFICELAMKKSQLSEDHSQSILRCIQVVHESGWKLKGLSQDGETGIIAVIKDVSKMHGVGFGICEDERVMIVNAIGLAKGRWFKCANDHFYCIGECGGAMQKAKCPECGLVIGGQSHLLATGNQHAPEMDNSRHPAWSEAANLANFDLANID